MRRKFLVRQIREIIFNSLLINDIEIVSVKKFSLNEIFQNGGDEKS